MTTPATGNRLGQQIIDLWYARRDVVPYQWYSAERQVGGYAKACEQQPPWANVRCVRKKQGQKCGACENFQPIPVDEKVIDLHLKGACTIGTYQLAEDGVSLRWMCLDFDDHGEGDPDELRDAVRTAHMALTEWGFPVSIEASGGIGWRCHLWTFFTVPVLAIKARVVLDALLQYTALGQKPFIERFPKQSRSLGGYGNLVKLPFGKHQKTGKRSCFLDPKTLEPMISIEQGLASVDPIDPANLEFIIHMRHLKLIETAPSEARAVKNFDYPREAMHKVITRCWYFQEVERRQISDEHSVHYEDWWNYVLMLARFGDAGTNRIAAFSKLDERYDEDYTINMINYIRQHGYHAPSCKRLREGPGQVRCPYDPLDCGAI